MLIETRAFKTGGGGTSNLLPVTFLSGDNNTVRTFNKPPSNAHILDIWGYPLSADQLIQIVSPNINPSARGLAVANNFLDVNRSSLIPHQSLNALEPNDQLSVNMIDTNSTDFGAYTFLYEETTVAGNYIDANQLQARGGRLYVVEVDFATATVDDYDGTVPINSTFTMLLRQKNYAWIGCSSDSPLLLAGLQGADLGGVRASVPLIDTFQGAIDYWARMSTQFRSAPSNNVTDVGKPGQVIPQIWGGNQDNLFAFYVSSTSVTPTPKVQYYFVELD